MQHSLRFVIIAITLVLAVKAQPPPAEYGFKDLGKFLDVIATDPKEREHKLDHEVNALASGDEEDIERLYEIALNPKDSRNSRAIKALSHLENVRAADTLVLIARGTDGFAAGIAVESLSTMSTDLSTPRLISLLNNEPPSVVDKREIIISNLREHPGEATERALIKQAENSGLRKAALSALGVIGTSRSLEVLKYYAENSTGDVQSISKYSMKRITKRMEGGNIQEEPIINAPVEVIQQAAQEVREAMKKEEDQEWSETGSQPAYTNRTAELRARTMIRVKEIMAERGEDATQLQPPQLIFPSSVNTNQVVGDTTEEKKRIRTRVEAIGIELSQIEEQALQVSEVKEAMTAYDQLLRAKMIEITPQNETLIRSDIDLKAEALQVVKQQARMNSEVKQAEQQAQALRIETMKRIDPKTQPLIEESQKLIQRFLELQQ